MSKEKEQKSIEWMFNEITIQLTLKGKLSFMDLVNITQQAKEMHRKELDLAYQEGKEIEHIQNTIEKNKHKHTEVTNEQRKKQRETRS
jgi:hypothetical protein